MKNISIKWKLFFYITLFVAVMLGVLWLFQIVLLDKFYKNIKTGQMKTVADSIAENIDDSELQILVTRLAQSENICILITDQDGKQLYSENVLFNCMIHRTPPEHLQNLRCLADENGGEYRYFFESELQHPDVQNDKIREFKGKNPPGRPDEGESLLYIQTVAQEDGDVLYIMLNSRISPVSSTTETLRIQLLIITLILVVLAFALALFISHRIAKPVIQINDSAKQLAQGKYDVSFPGGGYREIQQLSDTLNHAAYELSKVEELRRELIANVSHDLRTPLTMITGYAEAIRDLPGEDNAENAQIIIEEADRLTRLVKDLLDLSRLQSGAQELQLEQFSITDNIRSIIYRINGVTGQNIDVTFEAQEEIDVLADELQISQVVYNLLANAITHTAKGTAVLVKQTPEGNKVKIEVTDYGEGIPEDQLPYIWERYYKVDKTHTRAHVGNGLGLSIVRTILNLHGEEFGVSSIMGEGSTFWFYLPTAEN